MTSHRPAADETVVFFYEPLQLAFSRVEGVITMRYVTSTERPNKSDRKLSRTGAA